MPDTPHIGPQSEMARREKENLVMAAALAKAIITMASAEPGCRRNHVVAACHMVLAQMMALPLDIVQARQPDEDEPIPVGLTEDKSACYFCVTGGADLLADDIEREGGKLKVCVEHRQSARRVLHDDGTDVWTVRSGPVA
jgi:hypothetical protein